MYPSDLTDAEWTLIEPFFQRPDPRGNSGKYAKRAIINAILYVVQGGIQWRMLPKDFPPWDTVYDHFRRLNQRGVWQQALDALNQRSRRRQGKINHPSYAIIDSQSVKTQYASDERGYDGGKKSKGVNATSSPIPWVTYSAWSSMVPIAKIASKARACVGLSSINCRLSKLSPRTRAIRGRPSTLCKTGLTDASILLASQPLASKSSPSDGSSNAPSLGWEAIGAWPRTLKYAPTQRKTWSALPCSKLR